MSSLKILAHKVHYGYGLSEWEEALHGNASSHWLSPYPQWSLRSHETRDLAALQKEYIMADVTGTTYPDALYLSSQAGLCDDHVHIEYIYGTWFSNESQWREWDLSGYQISSLVNAHQGDDASYCCDPFLTCLHVLQTWCLLKFLLGPDTHVFISLYGGDTRTCLREITAA